MTLEKDRELIAKWREAAAMLSMLPVSQIAAHEAKRTLTKCADELEAALTPAEREQPGSDKLREAVTRGIACSGSEFCEHKTLEDCIMAAAADLAMKQSQQVTAAAPATGQAASTPVLVGKMRQFAEECLRRIALNPETDGDELHTKDTYQDILKLCALAGPATPKQEEGATGNRDLLNPPLAKTSRCCGIDHDEDVDCDEAKGILAGMEDLAAGRVKSLEQIEREMTSRQEQATPPPVSSAGLREALDVIQSIAQEMCSTATAKYDSADGYAYEKLEKYGERILAALSIPASATPAPPECEAERGLYTCTLRKGHARGWHVAMGLDDDALFCWPITAPSIEPAQRESGELTAEELKSCVFTFSDGQMNFAVTLDRINNFLRRKRLAAQREALPAERTRKALENAIQCIMENIDCSGTEFSAEIDGVEEYHQVTWWVEQWQAALAAPAGKSEGL